MHPVIIEWVPWVSLPAVFVLGIALPRLARFLIGFARALGR